MISIVTRLAAVRSSIPRAALAIHGTRMLSAGGDWNKKEKVEEDRYIRAKEHEAYLVRKAKENATKAHAELTAAQKLTKEQHDKAVAEVFAVLSKTGDKLSDAAVENFANWKIGHH